MAYTAKRESIHPLRMHSAVGRRLPAYATSLGRALLAELPVEARADMVPDSIASITANTTTDKDAVLEIIDEATRQARMHVHAGRRDDAADDDREHVVAQAPAAASSSARFTTWRCACPAPTSSRAVTAAGSGVPAGC